MNFLKRLTQLAQLSRTNEEATAVNEAAKEAADRDHEHALARLAEATEQADTLSGMNNRNHYSESLTYAFRGRTA